MKHGLTTFWIFLIVMLQVWKPVSGSPTTSDRNEEIVALYLDQINQFQDRIDELDGIRDRSVSFQDIAFTSKVNRVFFELLDSLQFILESSELSALDRAIFSQHLSLLVKQIYEKDLHQVDYFAKTFNHLAMSLHAMEDDRLIAFLEEDARQSLTCIAFFKHHGAVADFLSTVSRYHPDEILVAYEEFRDQPYARAILIEIVKRSPGTIKRYLNTRTMVNRDIREMEDEVVKLVVSLYDRYGTNRTPYPLLDDLFRAEIDSDETDAVLLNHSAYFRKLVQISKRKNKLAAYTLDKKLEALSLELIRQINNAHEQVDLATRFQPADNLSPEELYTLMVYSRNELFTSTFNGLYQLWRQGIGSSSGEEFLQEMGYNRFRTFMSLCAGFGQLEDFLATMDHAAQQLVLSRFVEGLDDHQEDISALLDVADLLATVSDTAILKALQQSVISIRERKNIEGDREGDIIYSLLLEILQQRSCHNEEWMENLVTANRLSPATTMAISGLSNCRGEVIQQHFFYDDDDGVSSFQSFMSQYQDANWAIEDRATYITIRSVNGKPIRIFANKPRYEEIGQKAIAEYFEADGLFPSIVVHRGHSYYAHKTISTITGAVKLLVLGSCGSYHQLSAAFEIAPDVQIISSKQIGTKSVNNPLLKLINEEIRNGRDLHWPLLWDQLGNQLSNEPYAYAKFEDYIPPHRNVGMAVLKAFRERLHQ